MAQCPQCKHSVRPDDRFCENCGHNLSGGRQQGTRRTHMPSGSLVQEARGPRSTQGDQSGYQLPRGIGSSKTTLACVGIFAILIIITAALGGAVFGLAFFGNSGYDLAGLPIDDGASRGGSPAQPTDRSVFEPAPTPTPWPTETPIPDTPADTVLNVGEMWRSRGVALLLREVTLDPIGIRFAFILYNNTPNPIVTHLNLENRGEFEVKDNLGWVYPFDMWGGGAFSNVGAEERDFNLAPNSSEEFFTAVRVEDSRITNPQVTELTVTVTVSRISEARWRVPIHH